MTVNHLVRGSSPRWGAKKHRDLGKLLKSFFYSVNTLKGAVMDKKPNYIDVIFKVAVILLMVDWTFALWKIADNIARLKP